jgi:hypothetical protein
MLVGMIAMADRWLIWAAYVLALIFITLTTLAGVPAVGLVLGAVIVFAAWQGARTERAGGGIAVAAPYV